MSASARALRNLPAEVLRPGVVSVLSIFNNGKDHQSLRAIFDHTNWRMTGVSSCREAIERLADGRIGVVICDAKLPDGSWKSFLRNLRELPSPPLLIVASGNDDVNLWAEVLNLGAYDVLVKPFRQDEVIRIVSLAWLHCCTGANFRLNGRR